MSEITMTVAQAITQLGLRRSRRETGRLANAHVEFDGA